MLASVSLVVSHLAEDTPLQRKKAVELQQQWGNKPCDHPTFSREYDLGERTGNYCCTQCGASLSFREKAELTAARDSERGRPRAGGGAALCLLCL